MKITPFHWTAAVCTALLLAACGKKDSAAPNRQEAAMEAVPAADESAPKTAATAESDATFLKEMKPEAAPGTEGSEYEEWFKKYHLDLNDPLMLAADADGDGVSNRDEFLAGTNPREAASHPETGKHPGMRFKEYSEVRLPIVLESVSGEKAVIRRTDAGEARTETVRAGETLRGLPLRVTKLAERQSADKDGNPTDRSQVVLEDTSTKERVTLVKDLPAKTSATYAVLASDDGKTTVKVHAGEVFAWPGEPAATYRVLDLARDHVVLQDQATMKLWTVPRQ